MRTFCLNAVSFAAGRSAAAGQAGPQSSKRRSRTPPALVTARSILVLKFHCNAGGPWGKLDDVSEVTRILERVQQGDADAAGRLLPLVYDELRRLAARRMAHEAPGQTLQPTALVHEAWLRLAGSDRQRWSSSGHFLGAAAEAMRRILIDKARRKNRVRHGKGFTRVDLDELDLAISTGAETLLRVDEALEKLEAEDKGKADLVKLRYFAGLSIPEAAQALGLSETTAKRHWAYARAWLYDELTREG
jgi:RNA polymerase sigma factor (TIGR02999 family)